MPYNKTDLTIELVSQILSLKAEGKNRSEIARIIGRNESTIRSWEHRGYLDVKPIAAGTTINPQDRRAKLKGKRFVFTSAQNNTFVFKEFLESLKVYCADKDAELIVGTFNYNKNGFQNGENEETWYDPLITDFILDESADVFPGLVWCGELNILPTAVNPLSGLSTYTKADSGIVPHVKVQLESIPTAKHDPCKMMYTTGTVTASNYIAQKSGQKAEFHHIYGALVAEWDSGIKEWFVRQLIADSNGHFQDLDTLYTPEGITSSVRVEAINWGDLHAEKSDPLNIKVAFGEGGMLDTLKPVYQFAHDSLDFKTRNHHNIKDMYFRYKQQIENDGKDLVQDDLAEVVRLLNIMDRDWCETIVVESNHDKALMRWLKESNPKEDHIWNAIFYHDCQLRILQAIVDNDEGFSIFEWCCQKLDPSLKAKFLRTDDSFIICESKGGGIECGNHGDVGPNGSRGSALSLNKLGRRQNIGHSHTAGILDGVYVSGVKGKLDMGYNIGPSSWSNSDIVTYPSGRRCIVTTKKNKWRAD